MFELLNKLCRTGGVSGDEAETCRVAADIIGEYADASINDFNSVIAVFGNKSASHTLLLDAHIDRIGFVVTDITDDGFLKVDKCGGTDLRTVLGSTVEVCGKTKLTGVVCCMPPHLSDGNEDSAISKDNVYIDLGLSYDRVKDLIRLGDTVYFSQKTRKLAGDYITAPALDNRAGVAAVIEAARLVKESPLECSIRVIALLSSQEETYQLGVKTGAFSIDADEAIAIDVSFASQPCIAGQYGRISPAKGPMVCASPVLDNGIYKKLIKLADSKNIPYQTEVCSGRAGTNADSIAITRNGIKSGLVSIPQRYMHTQAEVVNADDIKNTALLLSEYILLGGNSVG